MNKRIKIILITGGVLFIGAIAFILYQYFSHSTDAHLKAIPKNAAAVFKIKIKELANKADALKLLKEPAFQPPTEKGKSSLHELISDPFSTGIDPLENIYGFLSKDGINTVAAIVFAVDNAGDLKTFIEELKISAAVEKNEGMYFSAIDQKRCIAWNRESGIIMSTTGGDLKMISRKFLNQEKDQSILSNLEYQTFAEKTFDIGLYLDNKTLSQMSGAGNSIANLGFTDGHGELVMNFENEKISTIYSNFPITPAPTTVLKKSGFEENHFKAIAPSTPLAYLGIAADVNALFSTVENDAQMKDAMGDLENWLDLSHEDAKKLFNGDVSIAFTDFRDISTYDPRVGAEIDKMVKAFGGGSRSDFALQVPMAYVTVGITNEEKIKSILALTGFQNMGNFYAMPGISMIVYCTPKDGNLLITNDFYAAEAFGKSGKFTTVIPEAITKRNPFVFWVDMEQKHFPPSLMKAMKDNFEDDYVELTFKLLEPFKTIQMVGTDKGSELNIYVEPGAGNCLYRLLSYFGTIAK